MLPGIIRAKKIWLSRREARIEFQKGAVAWLEAFICFGQMSFSSNCQTV